MYRRLLPFIGELYFQQCLWLLVFSSLQGIRHRPIMYNDPMNQIRFTKQGYEKLKRDYEELLKSRPAAVDDLKKARDMGDLSENGYYKASKSKLSFIDARLRKFS